MKKIVIKCVKGDSIRHSWVCLTKLRVKLNWSNLFVLCEYTRWLYMRLAKY